MPLGIQRINAKKSHPNDRIIFIKPLKGPDEAIAQDFLERIAAQCLPIMKANHLSITSLEEYEPNREFVGRNFNAGEVIQLVLKSLSGHWLPFNYVQMVMMHELAHCKQMNHSRAFWAVRNNYADEMRLLWGRGYTGEGLWGRGALLSTGEWERNTVQPGEGLPEHLCGGTYRSRGRKRKAKASKPKLSYKEQKERRILKKFGANGVKLGEDEKVKKELEGGKKVVAKPRVAGSARGRELRAAAALARFEGLKKEKEEEEKVKQEEIDEDETGSGTESEEYEDEDDQAGVAAVDINGKKLLDGKGRGMIKVCEDENPGDQDAQRELRELMGFNDGARNLTPRLSVVKVEPSSTDTEIPENVVRAPVSSHKNRREDLGEDTRQKVSQIRSTVQSLNNNHHASTTTEKPRGVKPDPSRPPQKKENIAPSSIPKSTSEAEPKPPSSRTCPICSFANEPICITCTICANVLDPKNVVGFWACTSQTCQGSQYRNAGDCGVCGVCGERKRGGTG
ncbi:WLM-domain-containing protein [Neurospora hispaniola]|uniref:WLM-domain-containing protein n=1 Tax=Neurospora hispaniola TaxID=588809 RepID=A0AAJ0MTK2_9PEZI|nr:WLM-domain-containing protein [Neurospora hispaniola]